MAHDHTGNRQPNGSHQRPDQQHHMYERVDKGLFVHPRPTQHSRYVFVDVADGAIFPVDHDQFGIEDNLFLERLEGLANRTVVDD